MDGWIDGWCVCVCVCVCVLCVCVCVCVCGLVCLHIHNCLASCCASIRCSIPPGLLLCWHNRCTHSSGCESRRVLLDRFVAIATGNSRSHGQRSRKRGQSSFHCISGKRLPELCVHSLWLFFNDHFIVLATRNPSIAITSLVAASNSNPSSVLVTICERF